MTKLCLSDSAWCGRSTSPIEEQDACFAREDGRILRTGDMRSVSRTVTGTVQSFVHRGRRGLRGIDDRVGVVVYRTAIEGQGLPQGLEGDS